MTAPPQGGTRLAIYDMDLTITGRASWTPWLLDWASHEAPWRLLLLPLMLGPLLGYALGRLDRKALKEAAQRLMIGDRVEESRLDRRARRFAERFAARHQRADALAQMAADRAAGFRILIATASSRYYVRHLAALWGVADVVATENAREGGHILARIEGPNCYGAAKLALVEAWCAREGLARAALFVRAYSDHESDAPLLAWADEAIVVAPARRMARLAAARGWPVRQWR